jgi:NhaP-type Na+/H+ or K+/H+ antiporter
MSSFILVIIIIGALGLLLPWVSSFAQNKYISQPMMAILFGILLYTLPLEGLPDPDPLQHEGVALHLFELAVIISLISTGLKIDRRATWKNYKIPLLLVAATMSLSIILMAFFGWMTGLAGSTALLLAAVFAPTDPVLAEEVQVDFEEKEEEENDVRFILTAEAGLNDGMAFPFTWFAILAASFGGLSWEWIDNWVLKDVLYRIIAGVAVGYIIGRLFATAFLRKFEKKTSSELKQSFLIVAACLFIYGITEAIHGYGFIAAFISGLTIRQYDRGHAFHKEMNQLVSQVEQYFLSIVLILLGGYVVMHMFESLTLRGALLSLGFLFLIRPLTAYFSVFNASLPQREKWIISFMGIKGIGSLFYLAFALNETFFPQANELWATAIFLILVSVIMHGVSAFLIKSKIY